MTPVQRELDRVLTLLRNKIRERGFTQLEVQEALGWGRSYISQLLTKQKSLRVEQVLLILEVISVDPSEFFGELYHYPVFGRQPAAYGEPMPGVAPQKPSEIAEPAGDEKLAGDFARSFRELRLLVRGLLRLLVDKSIINVDELSVAVRSAGEGPMLAELNAD